MLNTDSDASNGHLKLSNNSSKHAIRRKELLALVNQLRAIGAQTELDLPRIAVIGNQSAGKSSVVEAISGINVPRDVGTCTRCPMECRLSSSDEPWSCTISIRWEFDEEGKPRGEVSERNFGDLIHDKSHVELALRRAQAAVLHPGTEAEKFLHMSAAELTKLNGKTPLPFSRNVICVDLKGPDLTDLSFVDLPGIIQNAEPDIVKLVEDLVVSHIKGNCLILVALPMTDDIENQKALRLARQEDQQGRRTIGVLTKPDMLTAGSTKSLDLWLEVLAGQRHQLTHGYYCTRQPDDEQRGRSITAAEARAAEAEFFARTTPWSLSRHTQRFGTVNLVGTLSTQLVQVINDMLPNIRKETSSRLAECTIGLAALPPPPAVEPAPHMIALLTTFCTSISQLVQGGSAGTGRLIQQNRDAYTQFKFAIRSTAPNFKPFLSGHDAVAFENCLGDGEDEGPQEGLISRMQPLYLKDMRKHIEKSITRELPDNIPFQSKAALIEAFQSSWGYAAEECFDRIRHLMLEVLFECVQKQFVRYENLQVHLKTFITQLVTHHYNSCRAHLNAVLETERTPFTQNTHYLQTCTEKWLAKYKDARAGKKDLTPEPSAKRQRTGTTTASTSKATDGISNTSKFTFSQSITSGQGAAPQSQPAKVGEKRHITGTSQENRTAKHQSATSTTGQRRSAAAGATKVVTKLPPKKRQGSTKAAARYSSDEASEESDASESGEASESDEASESGEAAESNSPPQSPSPATETRLSTPTRKSLYADKMQAALAALAEIGYTGLKEEDLGKLNPSDEYETELKVMAEVRGYFQVAYKRVMDNIPSLIDLVFVKAVAKELQPFLIAKLGLGSANAGERCALYLMEDPSIVARRDELLSRKKTLEGVEVEIYNFGL